jgi:hypothetical protein
MLVIRDTGASVLVERYVMAVLYFSTGGPKWSDDLRFLSNYSICEWPNIGEDESQLTTTNEVDCDDNGQVSKLSIGKSYCLCTTDNIYPARFHNAKFSQPC